MTIKKEKTTAQQKAADEKNNVPAKQNAGLEKNNIPAKQNAGFEKNINKNDRSSQRNTILNKNESVEVKIEDMSSEGLGIGHAMGMALFVKDAVVGDRIIAKITKTKKNYAYARMDKLLEGGPDRVAAFCPVARSCGGCQLQELSYQAQLALKQRKVKNNLERIGAFEDVSVEPVIGMDKPLHYRNKAQFPIGKDKEGKTIAGFYAGRTHSIVDNHRCLIGIDENEPIIESLLSYMKKHNVSAYDEKTHTGTIRHLMTRCGHATGQLMVVIVATKDRLPAEEELIHELTSCIKKPDSKAEDNDNKSTNQKNKSTKQYSLVTNPYSQITEKDKHDTMPGFHITSIVLNTNKDDTNVILGRKNRILFGEDYIEDMIGENSYRISSLSFYQVNPVQTEKLYKTVMDYAELDGHEIIWDLYCGTGTISLFLARRARKVIGVEIVADAIENAKKNAELNGIKNVEFMTGRAEDLVPALISRSHSQHNSKTGIAAEDKKKEGNPDLIVVDPPRKGLDETVIETILKAEPEKIVYVSCDSATLARDLKLLADKYKIKKVQPVDMFPHTCHVEVVTLLQLSNRKPDTKIRIDTLIREPLFLQTC